MLFFIFHEITYFANVSVLAVAITVRERVNVERQIEFDTIFTSFAAGLAWGEIEIGDVRFPFSCAPREQPLVVLVTGACPPRPEKPPTVMWDCFNVKI